MTSAGAPAALAALAGLAVVAAVVLLARAPRVPSWSVAGPLGAALGCVVGRVLGVRRAHVLESMRRAGVRDPKEAARAMYASLGRGFFELVWAAARPGRGLGDLEVIRRRPLDEALGLGRGAVVATAHTGSWDLVACAAAARVPLTVVTKRLSIGWLDRIWQRTRARRGVRLAVAGRALAAARSELGRGGAVAMLVDQAPERTRAVVGAPFLGQVAAVDLAPALVAMRFRAPLVAVFARRRADGTHVAEVAGVLHPPARSSRAWAEEAMRQVTAWLDAFVRRHPDQWLWMHRRWKCVGAGVGELRRGPGARVVG